MNAPYQEQSLAIPLGKLRICHVYRYMFQYKAIRIVTADGEEYIFEFQKNKYAERAIEAISELSPYLSDDLFTKI